MDFWELYGSRAPSPSLDMNETTPGSPSPPPKHQSVNRKNNLGPGRGQVIKNYKTMQTG